MEPNRMTDEVVHLLSAVVIGISAGMGLCAAPGAVKWAVAVVAWALVVRLAVRSVRLRPRPTEDET